MALNPWIFNTKNRPNPLFGSQLYVQNTFPLREDHGGQWQGISVELIKDAGVLLARYSDLGRKTAPAYVLGEICDLVLLGTWGAEDGTQKNVPWGLGGKPAVLSGPSLVSMF